MADDLNDNGVQYLGGWSNQPEIYNAIIDATEDLRNVWGAPTPGIGKNKTVNLSQAFAKVKGISGPVSAAGRPLYKNQTAGTCFPAHVMIRMACGERQPIDTVSVGDIVMSHTGKSQRVTATQSRAFTGKLASIFTLDGTQPLLATEEHPIAVVAHANDTPKWCQAGTLQFNPAEYQRVLAIDASGVKVAVPVASVELRDVDGLQVYNLEVEEDHSYVANGIAVHNCVGRGTARVCDLLQAMQVANGQCSWVARGSSEVAFAYARIEVGRGVHGQRPPSDGAVVAYAIEAARTFGFGLRNMPGIPGEDDDSLAEKWGNQSSGVPSDIEALTKHYLLKAWQPIKGYTDAIDYLASGYPIIFGTSLCPWGRLPANRDKDGFLSANGRTGHCWLAIGYTDNPTRPGVLFDNTSWGPHSPSGSDSWVNGPKGSYIPDMPEGCYLASPDVFNGICGQGEVYAVSDVAGFPEKSHKWMFI